LYSNRSACYTSLRQYDLALLDGAKCVEIAPNWVKGYNRKATAEYGLGKYAEAKATIEAGLAKGPGDGPLTNLLQQVNAKAAEPADPFGSMFNDSMWAKLAADPTTAPYLQDQAFVQKLNMIKANPRQFMTLMQGDQKIAQAMGVIMGLGASAMGGGAPGGSPGGPSGPSEEEMAAREAQMARDREAARQREELRLKKVAEEEAKAKAEADRLAAEEEARNNMTPEEKELEAKKARALEVKNEGNAFYKKKDFVHAIAKYQEATVLDPTNPTFHTNIASAHFGARDYDACIAACEMGLKVAEDNGIRDFKFVAKAWLRIGNANLLKKDYEKAIEAYDKSSLEHTTPEAKNQRKKAQNRWAAKKKKDYLDPEKALEAKALGNQLYGERKFPQAVEAYTDAIARDPTNHVFYSNRANCYAKLMSFGSALADCESCIKLNPQFSKIYIRKGKILHFQKRYKEAMDCWDIGLAIDPTSSEMQQGRRETMMRIQQENMSGEVDPERQAAAMRDPEIQMIMQDPTISNVLRQAGTDPSVLQTAMQNADIANKINKLVQAGIVRIG
jgi:stress-induced-phosphoprotein 1